MANEIYVGEAYKLVFPVLSNGYLNINYDTPELSPLWAHDTSFTIDAIITPYDVNGYGHGSSGNGFLTSEKTPPYPNDGLSNRASTYESVSILGATAYLTHKMMLFHNTNFKLYLQNTTSNSYNQPAEYKVVAEITDETGSTETISSEAVILTENKLWGYYDEDGYYEGLSTNLTKIFNSSSYGQSIISNISYVSGYSINNLEVGTELFNSKGVSIGVIEEIDGANIELVGQGHSHTSAVYISQPKEALYLEQMYKISFTYLKGGTLLLYIDDIEIARKKVSLKTVKLHGSDCKIGRGASNAEQFYGELFEICMHMGKEPSDGLTTLAPSYSNILFYYAFGV